MTVGLVNYLYRPSNSRDVYKRQDLIFACLRPEQTILGLILEDGDDHTFVENGF